VAGKNNLKVEKGKKVGRRPEKKGEILYRTYKTPDTVKKNKPGGDGGQKIDTKEVQL